PVGLRIGHGSTPSESFLVHALTFVPLLSLFSRSTRPFRGHFFHRGSAKLAPLRRPLATVRGSALRGPAPRRHRDADPAPAPLRAQPRARSPRLFLNHGAVADRNHQLYDVLFPISTIAGWHRRGISADPAKQPEEFLAEGLQPPQPEVLSVTAQMSTQKPHNTQQIGEWLWVPAQNPPAPPPVPGTGARAWKPFL